MKTTKSQSKNNQIAYPKRQLEIDNMNDDDSYDQQNQLIKVKIGKIPYGWYDQFKHFGYDNKLNPVNKQKQLNKIQQFIQKSQNKNWWKTIKDQLNGVNYVLTNQQLQLIDRIRSGKMASKTIANTNYSFQFQHNDPFPIHSNPPSKKSFMPSKWQQMKVNKILDGLLSGRIKWNQQPKQDQQQKLYDVWSNVKNQQRSIINIAPMKQKLPDHSQSYNPPKQYLLTPQQQRQWQQMDQQDRPQNFLPASYNTIRHIPFYNKLINQRFQRCLDLYLCPRIKKKKLNIDPDTLIPKLPDPSTLKPFPVALNFTYNGHHAPVISLAVSPTGDYLVTGDNAGILIIWDVFTSRILFKQQYKNEPIYSISWSSKNLILFSHGQKVQILLWRLSKEMKTLGQCNIELINNKNNSTWYFYQQNSIQYKKGFRIKLQFQYSIEFVQFHSKGQYFLTVAPDHSRKNQVIIVHHLYSAASQKPFQKAKGIIKKAYFHPRKPNLIILTQAKVFIYNLQKQAMTKKLVSNSDSQICLSVHPHGSHIIVGCEDRKLVWYDLDLSQKPYKTLQHHEQGITSTDFHQEYPLMASCSNDGTIQIFHAKVSSEDILQDAIILPLKILRGHSSSNFEGVKGIKFHPYQPWIFSIGYDHKVILWT